MRDTVVFDLGGVLVDWDPRHLYRRLFDDAAAMERFLSEVCTNWSAETFPVAQARFGFLALFRGIVVSGTEGVVKPDPAIYRLLLERFGLDPARCVFVDDNPANAAAATALGLHGIAFTTPEARAATLRELGLPA